MHVECSRGLLGANTGTKSALTRHQVSEPQVGPKPYQVRTKLPSRYQVVSSQGGTKWGPSRDQVRVRTPRLEALLKTVVVATRIGLGQKRLNGGAA